MPTPLQASFISAHNNQFLFSDQYLYELLPQDGRWTGSFEETRGFAEWLRELHAHERKQLVRYNEAQFEENRIRKILAQLGHVFQMQASVPAAIKGGTWQYTLTPQSPPAQPENWG